MKNWSIFSGIIAFIAYLALCPFSGICVAQDSGFDVLGPDTNLGEGRGDGPGTSYAFSLLFTAKVCPASTPGVSYGWNRVFQRRFVTIRPVTTLTTNYWYVDSADSSDYPTGIPTPRPDVDEGHWHTSIPSTDNNVVVMYDDPAMNLAYLTNYDNGIGINANLIVNEYAYQKILFTYTLTNSIGSANLLAIQQVGFISVAQKMHTNDVIAADWVGKSNIVTTSTIPDCTNVTLSEIRNIVGGTNAIVIDPEVTNNY